MLVASSISPLLSSQLNTPFAAGKAASTRPDTAVISKFSVYNVLLNFAT